jgi:SAM-dependent methyltransferase
MLEGLSAILRKHLPHPVKLVLRRASYGFLECRAWLVADPWPPRWLPLVGGGDFHVIGDQFLKLFVELGSLSPRDAVLDIGCGIGRMARPLTTFLDSAAGGCYEGFDVDSAAIDWCRRHISRPFPHFRFSNVDVYNAAYHPAGSSGDRFRFPYADGQFDFAIATSVFTHLMPGEARRYLHETSRVLRPGGRAFLTFFLLDREAEEGIAAGRAQIALAHPCEGGCVMDPAVPERAIGFDDGNVRRWLAESDLVSVQPFHYGAWSGRTSFTSWQDIVVVEKVAGDTDRRTEGSGPLWSARISGSGSA